MVALGVAAPFWMFALANAASVFALLSWSPPPRPARALPAERLWSALRVGLRHAVYNPHLRATLVRTIAVFPFGAAFIALLPLVARSQMTSGPQVYGLLLATASLGAAAGSVARPYVKRWIGPDRFVALGTIALAAAMVLLGVCRSPPFAFLAAFIAGAGWTTRAGEPQRLGAGGAAGLGARARAGDLPHRRVRLDLGRQHRLGLCGGAARPAGDAFHRGGRGDRLHPAVLVVAACRPPRASTSRRRCTGRRRSSRARSRTTAARCSSRCAIASPATIPTPSSTPSRRSAGSAGATAPTPGASSPTSREQGVYLETFLIGSWLEARYLRERVTNADREREDQVKALLAEPPTVTLDAARGFAEDRLGDATPELSYYFTTSETPA